VILSERYITDRFLPDKAIDVLDEAGSRANIKNVVLLEYEALKEELKKYRKKRKMRFRRIPLRTIRRRPTLR